MPSQGNCTREMLCDVAQAADAPIDFEHLARYTMADKALEKEILDLFSGSSFKILDDLRASQDEKSWHVAAHTMKGSARAIGAWRLADVALAAEKIRNLPPASTEKREALCAVEREAAAVQDFIKSL